LDARGVLGSARWAAVTAASSPSFAAIEERCQRKNTCELALGNAQKQLFYPIIGIPKLMTRLAMLKYQTSYLIEGNLNRQYLLHPHPTGRIDPTDTILASLRTNFLTKPTRSRQSRTPRG
jgi:hypothetical protein